jgi:hypothetical protein
MTNISKNDGNRYSKILTHYVDHSMYSKIKNVFDISMAAILLL